MADTTYYSSPLRFIWYNLWTMNPLTIGIEAENQWVFFFIEHGDILALHAELCPMIMFPVPSVNQSEYTGRSAIVIRSQGFPWSQRMLCFLMQKNCVLWKLIILFWISLEKWHNIPNCSCFFIKQPLFNRFFAIFVPSLPILFRSYCKLLGYVPHLPLANRFSVRKSLKNVIFRLFSLACTAIWDNIDVNSRPIIL